MMKKVIIENFTKEKSKSLPGFFHFQNYSFSFFKKHIFDRKKKLRNFLIYYIDVKFAEESIFRIFRAI